MDGAMNIRAFVQRWQVLLIAGGVALIAALMAAAYFAWFHQPYAVLFKDLRTMDAATIVAELDKRKVPYELADGGRAILVPRKLVDATRLAVMSQDIPLKGVVGFELFSKSDMGLTEFAQRINYRRALQGEIARTIMALDSVESARVNLTLSEPTVFREEKRPSKASVSIVPRGGRRLTAQSVRGIQRLTAAAVPDLQASDVVILDGDGAVISGAETSSVSAVPPSVQQRAAIEEYYAGRVRLALRSVLPDDQVTVAVNAGWGASADPAEGDALANWSPATRRFPLSVDVTTSALVGPQVRETIDAIAGEAIGRRPDTGDAVTVSYASPAGPTVAEPAPFTSATVAPPPPPPDQPAPARLTAPSKFWISLSLAVIVVLLGFAALLHRRSPRPRRLSPRQRDAFAHQLRKLLDQGDADAPAGG
jgi:flagellar M-ring protein FliF